MRIRRVKGDLPPLLVSSGRCVVRMFAYRDCVVLRFGPLSVDKAALSTYRGGCGSLLRSVNVSSIEPDRVSLIGASDEDPLH